MRASRRALSVAVVAAGLAMAQPSLAQAATVSSTVAETTTLTGTVDVVVVDAHHHQDEAADRRLIRIGPDQPTLVTTTMVSAGGRTLPVPAGLARGLRAGQRVQVTVRSTRAATRRALSLNAAGAAGGAVIDHQVTAVQPVRAVTVQSTTATSTARPAAGQHRLTILPVYWSATDGQTVDSLTALGNRTAAYWAAQSGGSVAITPVVKGWQRITDPGSCDSTVLFDRALAAHGQANPTTLTDHVLVYFPNRTDCGGWAGLGSVSGSRIWVNGYALIDVFAHEFGHNLGLGHANRATCTAGGSRVALSLTTACSVEAYKDEADVMGIATWAASGNLNTALADQLGLVRTVTATAGAPVSLDLAPLGDVSAVRAVKVDVGTGWVYVDFRPAQSPDLRQPEWAGVQVHYLPNGAYPQSQLLDLQPWRASAFQGTSMPAFSVWRVPGSPVAISVGQVGSTAQVRVVPTAADTLAPTAPDAHATRTSSTVVNASWTAASDAGSGLAGYRLWADGVLLGHAAPSATGLELAVPSTASALRVEAVDAAGNTATSAPVGLSPGTADKPDTTAPSAPTITAPTNGSTIAGRTLTWSWTEAVDPESAISSYLLYADGKQLKDVLPGDVRSVLVELTRTGTTRLAVAAVNSAGLLGPRAETSVTVDPDRPAAPRNVKLIPGTGQLTWTAPSDTGTPLHYEVGLDGAAAVSTTRTISPMSAAGGRRVWTVRAVDAAGNASPVVTLTTPVDTSPPTTPVATLRTAKGAAAGTSPTRAVTLTWQPSADADSWVAGYRVQLQGASSVRTLGPATTQVTLPLPEGASTVLISAVNGGGAVSTPARVRVLVDTTAPSAPSVRAPATATVRQAITLSLTPGIDAQSGVVRHEVTLNGRVVAVASGLATSVTLPSGTLTTANRVRIGVTAVNATSGRSRTATTVVTVRGAAAVRR